MSTAISDRIDGTVLLFHPNEYGIQTFLRKVLERLSFGVTDTPVSTATSDD